MKGIFKILSVMFFFVLLFAFGIRCYAEGEGRYIITSDDLGFHAYRDGEADKPPTITDESLGDLLRQLKPSYVYFSNITSDSFTFPDGDITVSGGITLSENSVITISKESNINFANISITAPANSENAIIRVKGGSLEINGANISGGRGGCISLDYSATSTLTVNDGVVSSSSDGASIHVLQGTANICGGRISNAIGAGVMNFGSLAVGKGSIVCGNMYDIVTNKPISVIQSCSGDFPRLRIQYESIFSKGSLTEILYSADESYTDFVRLFDKNGREYDLAFFEKSKYSDETNFCAVFLPFTVTVVDKNGVQSNIECLNNETVTPPEAVDIEGYASDGFYTDIDWKNKFDFSTPITSDIKIYAKYRLSPISFSITGLDFVYDGDEHSLGFSYIFHALEDLGSFTYEWYRDGVLLGCGKEIALLNVRDSGTYSCKLTFHYMSDSVSVDIDGIRVNISPFQVRVHDPENAIYNGALQFANVAPSDLYCVIQEGGVEAGSYKVRLELSDKENYSFEKTNTWYTELDFVIEQSQNSWTTQPKIYNSYLGSSLKMSAKALFGDIELWFSYTQDGEYSQIQPQSPGVYFVKFRVPETKNYKTIETEPMQFKLLVDSVASIYVTSLPDKTVYTAFERFDMSGIAVVATYQSGKVLPISHNELTVRYQQGECFLFYDNGIILSFGDVNTVLPLTVNRAAYDTSGIVFTSDTVLYNGEYHTISISSHLPYGADGIPLRVKIEGGGTDVGSYTVRADFYTDSPNYSVPQSIFATLTVTPLPVTVSWQDLSFVYDGTPKLPVAIYTDINGNKRYFNVSGAVSRCGTGYVATATAPTNNYEITNPTACFDILKADYDFSKIIWTENTFIYDGTVKRVTVSGLPDGVTVIGYTDGMATNAGDYIAYAILDYDEHNYNRPSPLSCSWHIAKSSYNTSGFYFPAYTEVVYDGGTHYPTLVGSMPIGKDGHSLSYSFSEGAYGVSQGAVKVTVSFSTESKNYIPPNDIEVLVSVIPREITVSWGENTHIYDGKAFLPVAKSELCSLSVSGEAVNAGTYTATCLSKDPNYRVVNSTYTFVIGKASNEWKKLPTALSIYESESVITFASALFGNVKATVYTDSKCTEEVISPLTHGSYFLKYSVDESENFLPITSGIISLTVIKVAAVSMSAYLYKVNFIAFDTLSPDDLSVTVAYNDGSLVTVTDNIVIQYQGSSCFLADDTEVTLFFDGVSQCLSVTVAKADFDMSGVMWQGIYSVYDGMPKAPYLSGLPSGLSVKEYKGAGKINSGEYTVFPIFSYDEKNYNPPQIEAVSYFIEKKDLDYPKLLPKEYNGTYQLPTLTVGEFLVLSEEKYKNTGVYKVKVALKDSENYKIVGTNDSYVICDFEITPRPVFLATSDILMYKWSDTPVVSFEAVEGGVLLGDNVSFSCQLTEDGVAFVSSDPNYKPIATGGKLIYLNRPSPSVMSAILILSIVTLLTAFTLIFMYLKRDSLRTLIAAGRCKRNIKQNRPLLAVVTPKERSILPEAVGCDISPFTVNTTHADSLISDSLAKNLIKRERDIISTEGKRKCTVNIDTLSQSFNPGDTVDINSLKEKGIVSKDCARLKILARGNIDKPLFVLANDFSLCAVKMIVLTGGEARKVTTVRMKIKGEKSKNKGKNNHNKPQRN